MKASMERERITCNTPLQDLCHFKFVFLVPVVYFLEPKQCDVFFCYGCGGGYALSQIRKELFFWACPVQTLEMWGVRVNSGQSRAPPRHFYFSISLDIFKVFASKRTGCCNVHTKQNNPIMCTRWQIMQGVWYNWSVFSVLVSKFDVRASVVR